MQMGLWKHLLLLSLAYSTLSAQQSITVYVVNDLVRVRPSDAPGSMQAASISGARNEYVPFQIVVRAGSAGLQGVNALAGDLHMKRAFGMPQSAIPAANITLYREFYINVTKPTASYSLGAGLYPDALIPFIDPATGRPPVPARFPAAPFDVQPNSSQPLWVDVYVPQGAAPGIYTGAITVSAQNQPSVTVPITLTVWHFDLPDVPSFRSNFGGIEGTKAVAGLVADSPVFNTLEYQYSAALASNLICPLLPDAVRPKVNAGGAIDASATDAALHDFMNKFHVNGITLPLQGSDPLGQDRNLNVNYLHSMWNYLKANGWDSLAYNYTFDEPATPQDYNLTRQTAQFIHQTQPGIKVLVTGQPLETNPAVGTLVGSVDIWVALWSYYQTQALAGRMALGEEAWSYTALIQNEQAGITPFWELDFPLLNYRVPLWINWQYGLAGLLYWTPIYWDEVSDPWSNPLTFQGQYNGEGVLLYPGADAGVQGFVQSMRFRQIRQGMQDYEYLKLLAAKDPASAKSLAAQVARSWTDWNPDPAVLYSVRDQIARLIAGKPRIPANR